MSRLALAVAAAAVLLPFGGTATAQEPVHVTTHVAFAEVSPGSFQSAECAVENTSGQPLLVIIQPSVTYADGEVQDFRLNQPPTMLAPGEAFILSVAFAVPEDAAPGTATFDCTVRAVGQGGGGAVVSDSSTFEVV